MKKLNIRGALCILLIIAMLPHIFSCEKKDDKEYLEGQRVEIIRESVGYSDEFIEKENLRFNDIAISVIEDNYGIKLNNEQKQKINQEFKKTVIPMLYRVRIYDTELEELFDTLQTYLDGDTLTLTDVYKECVFLLGTTRAGMMLHELSVKIIGDRAAEAQEKYNKYKYEWYLEDATRCENIKDRLIEMGEGKFVNAVSIITALTSLFTSLRDGKGESAFLLSDAELIYILGYQSDRFKEYEISEDEWSTIGALFSEMIPSSPSTPSSALLYALKNENYLAESFKTMPDVASYFSMLMHALQSEGRFSLNASDDEKIMSIVSAVLTSRENFDALAYAISEHASTDTDEQERAISSFYTEEEISAFYDRYTKINSDELFARLSELSESEDPDSIGVAKDAFICYITSIAPHIAFLLFQN